MDLFLKSTIFSEIWFCNYKLSTFCLTLTGIDGIGLSIEWTVTFSRLLDILSDLEQDFVSCLLSSESSIAVGTIVGLLTPVATIHQEMTLVW